MKLSIYRFIEVMFIGWNKLLYSDILIKRIIIEAMMV